MQEYVFELSGGRLCLDFANTLSDRPAAQPVEHLGGYDDLVAFARQAGAIGDETAARLRALGAQRGEAAAAVHRRAIALREAIYGVFAAVARGEGYESAALEAINREVAAALGHARVVPVGERFDWGWEVAPEALDAVLWPIARSAAELLVGEELTRVRVCGGSDCDWLFVDTSKNRSRQWCDMRVCGNRAKARRFQAKRRGGS